MKKMKKAGIASKRPAKKYKFSVICGNTMSPTVRYKLRRNGAEWTTDARRLVGNEHFYTIKPGTEIITLVSRVKFKDSYKRELRTHGLKKYVDTRRRLEYVCCEDFAGVLKLGNTNVPDKEINELVKSPVLYFCSYIEE